MRKKKNIIQYSLDEFIGLSRKSKTDWSRALRMTPEEIERNAAADADDFTNDPEFWKNARLLTPVLKDKISLRLDRDILKHFRKQGRGYQSLINAILKAYVATKENGKA